MNIFNNFNLYYLLAFTLLIKYNFKPSVKNSTIPNRVKNEKLFCYAQSTIIACRFTVAIYRTTWDTFKPKLNN